MSTDQQSWVVSVAAHSPGPFESASIRNILEQSDLGGDIQSFCGGTMSITLTLAVTAPAEHKAYQRVLARVKDALGSRWEVQAMGQPTSRVVDVSALSLGEHHQSGRTSSPTRMVPG